MKEINQTLATERNRAESINQESVVLVGVLLPEHRGLNEEPLDELRGLAETAGVRVVGELLQKRETPDKTTYLGAGKVDELRVLVEAHKADVVIFDNDLNPAQTRNLEKAVNAKVLDRTELILDIFATRAQTYEARLAVELAQLQYSLPRLKRMWTHLSRIKAGVGMRGPGEKQLEVDRRLVEKRIHDLETELSDVQDRRRREVEARADRMTVSLVGYTNAGKSTLLNALTHSDVLAENRLFATLDTRTRRWQLPGWGPVLLSDTVGFVRQLPHHLVASFRATLEEARQAHLLLHVADAGNPAVLDQVAAVYKVLEELQIQAKDTLLVLNKIDSCQDLHTLDHLFLKFPHAIPISARTGKGLDHLTREVSKALSRSFKQLIVESDVGDGKLLAMLAEYGEIQSRQFSENRVVVHCRLPERYVGVLRSPGRVVREVHDDSDTAWATSGSRASHDEHLPLFSNQETSSPDAMGEVA